MTELDKLLVQEDKGMENAENTPAKILRGLINDMNISPMQMIQLLNAWLNRIRRNGKPLDGNERSNRRGNLIKEISRDALTWNVFEKAIAVLDFDEWEISFKGKKNGQTYRRTVKYHIRTPQDLDQFIKHLEHGEYIEHRQIEEEKQELAKTAATRSMARVAAAYTSDWITAKIASKHKF